MMSSTTGQRRSGEGWPGWVGGGVRLDARAQRLLTEWWGKARFAARLAPGELWPGWSTGEVLAVALILGDTDRLAGLDYTREEALDRLRFDIGQPSVAAAAAVFDRLGAQLARRDGRGR